MIITYVTKLYIFFILIILSGCISTLTKNEKKIEINKKFYINENIYLVYKGVDESGCKFFTPYSNDRRPINVIYYIKKNNNFTINRDEAECKK